MTVARNLTICTGLLALAALSGAAVGPAVTGAAVVVGVAGSLACNLAASRIDAAGKSFLGRWTALRQGKALDPNHDEARALRQAQLAALRNLLDEWQAVPGGEFADLRRTAHAALEWARTELKASVKGDATDASAVEAALRDALPLALAEMAGAPRGETAASAAIDLRRLAENAVLAELAAAGHPLEGEAERRFRDPGTGWFARFAVQGAAKIKHDAAARHIWMAMRLALVDERTATIEEFAASNDEQVRAIAAEVNKLSALAARIDDQIFGTPPVLMLLPEVRPMSAADRFSFRNPDIPFRGRGDELAELDAFLDDERPFAWHMLVGGGGAGKSRLALELCKRRDGDWRVGFAPREGNETVAAHTLNAWQPRKSHLIIVDYVLANSAMTTALLTMGVANGGRYGHKLRVLLIERADEDFQRAQLWGAAQERQGIEAARWRSDALNVGEQTDEDIFALAGPFLGGLEIERADFLARHAEVDPERRTLTALILAEAMAAGEGEAATLSALIGRLVARERKRWRAMGIRPAVEEPLLALSTMIDGYEAARDAERLPQPLQNALSDEVGEKGFAALRSEAPPTEAAPGRLGRLLPDLVGEFFALDLLAASVAATGAPRFPWLAEAAWRAGDGWNTAEFAWRARRDFGGHPGLQALRRPVAGVSQSYAFEVFDHVEAAAQSAGEKREAFPEEAFRVLATYDDWAARLAEADLLTAFAGESGWHFSAGRIAGFITALADVATRPAVPVELLVRLASSVFAFVTTRSDGNPEEARALLDRLGAASAVAGAPPEVRVEWAKSVFNYILHTDAAAPEPTQALLERLEAASAVAGAPPELRVLWAKSVTNYILHTAAVAPESARALLDELKTASAVTGAPPELREEWVKSVFNYILHTAAVAPESARALLDDLQMASAVAGAPPELREEWAKSVFNYTFHTDAAAPESARALLDELKAASAVAGAPPELQVWWAQSVTNYIGRTAAAAPKSARALLDELATSAVAGAPPELQVEWARSVYNYITHVAAAAPEPARALLDELKAASAVAGAPPELQVWWVKSVFNYIVHTAALAPESARALLDDLQTASAVAGAPPELREEWAKSVFNYIFHTAAAAPESARALLDELEAASAVAGAPPELRVQWVKSVFNYILHTGAVAPESACALLDDLQTASAVAGAPPEVREQWAKSSAAFIAGRCSAKDFNGARAFYATVASRWRERPEPKLWFGWAAAVRFLLEAQREDAADAVLLPDLLSDLLFLADVAADDPRVMDVLAPLDDHIARARENVPRGDGSGPGN